ncbi:hypothetical protein BDB01DRAFT_803472 [Pilobolus umbonatus]|nr:hypothetical protein BDB01DRAFT_803472 [Pilobolus umbonatus]
MMNLFQRSVDLLLYSGIYVYSTVNAAIVVAQKDSQCNNTNSLVIHGSTHDVPPPIRIRKPRSSRRFIQKLPNEILLNIFECMNERDLYNCTSVCNKWNKLITPVLWRSPVPIRPIISCSVALTAIDKAKNTQHHHQKSHLYPGFPIYLPQFGHSIRSIDLSLIASHVTDCTVRYIIKSCPQLTSLSLSNCRNITNDALQSLSRSIIAPQLEILILNNCRLISDEGLYHLSEACKSLRTIHLGSCHRISHDGITKLVTASGSTLRRISLSDCIHVTGQTIHTIAHQCGSRLEWLDIARVKNVRHVDLENLIKKCPNITRLNLALKKTRTSQDDTNTRQRSQMDIPTVEHTDNPLLHYDPNPLNELITLLRRYNISPELTESAAQHQQYLIERQRQLDLVSNRSVEMIATRLCKLELLDLSNWTYLTDPAVQIITAHGQNLQQLNLSGCYGITSDVLGCLSNLCDRKSTRITLNNLMISSTYDKNDYSIRISSDSSSASTGSSRSRLLKNKPSTASYEDYLLKDFQ